MQGGPVRGGAVRGGPVRSGPVQGGPVHRLFWISGVLAVEPRPELYPESSFQKHLVVSFFPRM